MENKYYYPEYDLNGTADELFIQARNGYIEDPQALQKICEILQNPTEKKDKYAFYVSVLKQMAEDDGENPYNLGKIKLDILDNVGVEDVTIRDNLTMEILHEQGQVVVSLQEHTESGELLGSAMFNREEFLAFSKDDFKEVLSSIYAYNMTNYE